MAAPIEGGRNGEDHQLRMRVYRPGDDDDAVLADLEAHIRRDHPDMVGKYGRNELLDMIEEV